MALYSHYGADDTAVLQLPGGATITAGAGGINLYPGGTQAPSAMPVTTAAGPVAMSYPFPVISTLVVGGVGYWLGAERGQARTWAIVGALIGYFFRPLG
jgi:hypothetical protein